MNTAEKEKDESHSLNQAKCQLEGIMEMVAALGCDYDRLEELKDERADLESEANDDTNVVIEEAKTALADWDEENGEELKALTEAAGEFESREDAEQRIQEDPLSVEVRSDWHEPGGDNTPGEFCILLCTGGPACRIVGDLDQYGQPTRARIEHQDWFKPWQEYITNHEEHEALLTYARCFYYEEGK